VPRLQAPDEAAGLLHREGQPLEAGHRRIMNRQQYRNLQRRRPDLKLPHFTLFNEHFQTLKTMTEDQVIAFATAHLLANSGIWYQPFVQKGVRYLFTPDGPNPFSPRELQ
jgi:hypothetical protein